jgi:hypothetical protein
VPTGLDLVGLGWTCPDWVGLLEGSGVGAPSGEASRGGFTRQPVNVGRLQGLTKVLPVRLPVRRRQASRQVFQPIKTAEETVRI